MTTRRALYGLVALSIVAIVLLMWLWMSDRRGPATQPAVKPTTFGDLMRTPKMGVIDPKDATAAFRARPPRWDERREIRWDDKGSFTYSLRPKAYGARVDEPTTGAAAQRSAAEFYLKNAAPKNADVTFTVTGRRFAIRYLTFGHSDAMVWLDDRPVASEPFRGVDRRRKGTDNWIEITLPTSRTVDVRFAGPFVFSGVDHPADEPVTVTATPPRFTIGVVSDSFYETSLDRGSMSTSAAPSMSTLTGFRVWNMAQGGTGYVNPGADPIIDLEGALRNTSPYGSNERLNALTNAPIDALLLNGSINDAPFTVSEHRQAVDRYLAEIERRFPTLPIIIVGLEPISTSSIPDVPTDHFLALTRNLERAAAENDNVVGFIDPYTPNWFTGTGSSKKPRDNGNQDEYIGDDGLHPNGAGQMFYQKRIVEQLRDLPVSPFDK